uniref:Waprin-Thr1 n=1 Tax=Thrasops jacksonii TaxID=186611 RepID=WAP1_THRJA|nr:RecName: Full=Waprin-Thr1; Flags: Precursor [Thrasops jacksonii]ABU68540.1 Waprin-Thr1 [Thrasops jacksonii]
MKARLLLLSVVILVGMVSAENEKAGSCPDVNQPIPPLGLCRNMCESDSGCPNNEKCCKNGCGFMTCSRPR